MLKFGILAIAIVTAFLLTTSVARAILDNVGQDPSANLSNQVRQTQHKAQTLDTTFIDIMPPTPPGQPLSHQPARQTGTGAPHPRRAAPATPMPTSIPTDPLQPGQLQHAAPGRGKLGPNPRPPGQPDPPAARQDPAPEPTRNPYAIHADPSDDLAAQSVQRMDQIAKDLEITPDRYADAVNIFYAEWDTRYQMARHQHQRFAHRVHQADLAADDYFAMQRELTESMPNRERRQHYRLRDAEEKLQYREWQQHAYEILSQSNIIMDELRQMNIEITKQKLSANFAALYRDFEQVPLAITMLHEELDLFRYRSQQLQLRFQDPT